MSSIIIVRAQECVIWTFADPDKKFDHLLIFTCIFFQCLLVVELCQKNLNLFLKTNHCILMGFDSTDVVLIGLHTEWGILDHIPELGLFDTGDSIISHQGCILPGCEVALSGLANAWFTSGATGSISNTSTATISTSLNLRLRLGSQFKCLGS